MIEKIKILEEENKKLKERTKTDNIYNNNIDYNINKKLKKELEETKSENEKLKKEINNLKKIIDLKNKQNRNINHNNKNNLTYSISNEKINNNNNNDSNSNNNPIKVKKSLNNKFINYSKKPRLFSLVNKKIYFEGRYTPSNMNRNLGFNYHHKHRNTHDIFINYFSIKTEPSYGTLYSFGRLKKMELKNKYSIEPLEYSNYLLDNLKDNISKNFLK